MFCKKMAFTESQNFDIIYIHIFNIFIYCTGKLWILCIIMCLLNVSASKVTNSAGCKYFPQEDPAWNLKFTTSIYECVCLISYVKVALWCKFNDVLITLCLLYLCISIKFHPYNLQHSNSFKTQVSDITGTESVTC